jgi:hypothetical protein
MRRFSLLTPAMMLCASFTLVSCTQVNVAPTAPTPSATVTTEPSATKLASETTVTPVETAAAPPTVTAAVTPAASPAASPTDSFGDIKGLSSEEPVRNLATLGIIDKAGQFKPFEPITRAEFVRWVVTANNVYANGNALTVLKAAETPEATFVDVKPSDPDWKYIQGLANAGYVVGIDKTHFAPNRPITREEMIMIKAQLDEGSEIKTGQFDHRYVGYSDLDKANPDYIGAMYHDTCATTTNNSARIWGSIKVLNPKKPLTRSEAAICVSECRSGTAKKALEKS